ncbi:hypothetical protein DRO97_10535 [Archaeoglobales archaeon]|nr:MAG: hypothetical protein DRO97_10535 [Archaeoglobales archaeon]
MKNTKKVFERIDKLDLSDENKEELKEMVRYNRDRIINLMEECYYLLAKLLWIKERGYKNYFKELYEEWKNKDSKLFIEMTLFEVLVSRIDKEDLWF